MNKGFLSALTGTVLLLFLFAAMPADTLAQAQRVSLADDESQADRGSYQAAISDDGRFIAFRSNATNLVAGDTNNRWDIFLRDRQTGTTIRLNNPTMGEADIHSYLPVISGNGNVVAFESDATNLITGDTNGEKDIFIVNVN